MIERFLRSTLRTDQITGDIDEPRLVSSAFWSAGVWVWWNKQDNYRTQRTSREDPASSDGPSGAAM
jgi:hypothetical protein